MADDPNEKEKRYLEQMLEAQREHTKQEDLTSAYLKILAQEEDAELVEFLLHLVQKNQERTLRQEEEQKLAEDLSQRQAQERKVLQEQLQQSLNQTSSGKGVSENQLNLSDFEQKIINDYKEQFGFESVIDPKKGVDWTYDSYKAAHKAAEDEVK
jgi:hypothetical protein